MDSSIDPHKVLMVRRDASSQEIRAAFIALIGQWHPDVTSSPEAHHRSAAIIQAYRTLLQPERRRASRRCHAAAAAPPFPTHERRFGERRIAERRRSARPDRLPRAWRVVTLTWAVIASLSIASTVAMEVAYGPGDEIEWTLLHRDSVGRLPT